MSNTILHRFNAELRPKLGQYIHPLQSYFHHDDGQPTALRGHTVEKKVLCDFIEGLRTIETPEDRDPHFVESIAHKCALNPNNKPGFSILDWETDMEKRRSYWLKEFKEAEEHLFASALNIYKVEFKRFYEIQGLLEDETLESEGAEVLVEYFKLGII